MTKFTGTKTSAEWCEAFAEDCEGVCTFAFSRGKDSIAAFLYLKDFFDKIIPYHLALIPGLRFVNESLEYYENVLDTEIERYMMHIATSEGLDRQFFQDPYDAGVNSELDMWKYEFAHVNNMIRKERGLPEGWGAESVLSSDSLVRRIAINKSGPFSAKRGMFFPIADWTPTQVLEYTKHLALAPDYLMSGRTLCSIPNADMMDRMEEHYPDDAEKVKKWFPLVRAQNARNHFRKLHFSA